MYLVKATSFRGTNVLDDIEMDGTLFLIHHVWPSFREDTGVLRSVVYVPVLKALDDLHERECEMK